MVSENRIAYTNFKQDLYHYDNKMLLNECFQIEELKKLYSVAHKYRVLGRYIQGAQLGPLETYNNTLYIVLAALITQDKNIDRFKRKTLLTTLETINNTGAITELIDTCNKAGEAEFINRYDLSTLTSKNFSRAIKNVKAQYEYNVIDFDFDKMSDEVGYDVVTPEKLSVLFSIMSKYYLDYKRSGDKSTTPSFSVPATLFVKLFSTKYSSLVKKRLCELGYLTVKRAGIMHAFCTKYEANFDVFKYTGDTEFASLGIAEILSTITYKVYKYTPQERKERLADFAANSVILKNPFAIWADTGLIREIKYKLKLDELKSALCLIYGTRKDIKVVETVSTLLKAVATKVNEYEEASLRGEDCSALLDISPADFYREGLNEVLYSLECSNHKTQQCITDAFDDFFSADTDEETLQEAA